MTSIFLPLDPIEGQVYVATNTATYIWLGDRWNTSVPAQSGQAVFYSEGGNSDTWNSPTDVNPGDITLDGGDANNDVSFEFYLTSAVDQSWGYLHATYELYGVTNGNYDEQGIIIATPGNCNYETSLEYCEEGMSISVRVPLRVNYQGYIDCLSAIENNIVDGSFMQSVPTWGFSNQNVEVRAYVKRGQDVYLSNVITTHITYVPCFVTGTMITLADGSKKPVEEITYDDELLVWDFDNGVKSKAKPLWIKKPQSMPEYNLSRYSDGTELKTLQVVKGHRVYNKTQNKFTFICETNIGDTIIKDGGETTLVSVEHAKGTVVYYNIITDYHMNVYANGILTSTGFNNLYPMADMKYIKEPRISRSYVGIADHWVKGLRLAENTTEDVVGMAKHLAILDSLKQDKNFKITKPPIPKYHWKREKKDTRDHIYALQAVPLPKKVDLRNFATRIEDQGELGSCTGNAIADAIELICKKLYNKYLDVSRLFIYYQERLLEGTINLDAGAYIRDGFKAVNKWGAPLESYWPYIISRWMTRPSQAAYTDAAKRKVVNYQACSDFNAVRNALASGKPVVIGFDVYSSFDSGEWQRPNGNGLMPYPNVDTEEYLGGHAVCLVGYDDNLAGGRFIVRNSWGVNWADKGYFYMPYQVIQNKSMSSDFWTLGSVTNPK